MRVQRVLVESIDTADVVVIHPDRQCDSRRVYPVYPVWRARMTVKAAPESTLSGGTPCADAPERRLCRRRAC